ncbi:hypothetical protein, partial [Fervidobacterium thailandense]
MKVKRLLVLLCVGALLLLSQPLWALDLETAKSLYVSMLDGKHEFSREVKKSIFEELPFYRFFKIYIVGSVERTETTKKTGDYLEPFFLESIKGDNEETILAKAIYLTWWEAKLNNRPHTVEIVKNSPIFNDFFNEYQMRITEAFGNYAQDLAAFLLGVDVDVPYVPEELTKIREKIVNADFVYEPVYDGRESHVVSLLMSNPDIVKSIVENFGEIRSERDKFDAETLLSRTRAMIFRTAFSQIAGLKDEIAQEFVKLSPKSLNLLWVRWIAYLIIFLIGYFKLKNTEIPLMLLLAGETVYIGTALNISSPVDGMIYGIAAAVAILFSIFYFVAKKKWNFAILSLLTLVSLFIPQAATTNLIMTDNFTNSPFYNSLLQDVLRDPLGKVQRSLKNYNTALNESVQSFSSLIGELGISDTEIDQSLFEPSNFDGRIKFAGELKLKHKDQKNLIDDFLYFERKRASSVMNEIANVRSVLTRAAEISSEPLRREFYNFVESNFEGQHRELLEDALRSTKTKRYVAVGGFSVRNIFVSYLMLYVALFLIALNRRESFIPIAGAFASSLVSFFNAQEFFVQSGVPTILISLVYQIPIGLILTIILGLLWFRGNHSF